jgi:hypothetical protein
MTSPEPIAESSCHWRTLKLLAVAELVSMFLWFPAAAGRLTNA